MPGAMAFFGHKELSDADKAASHKKLLAACKNLDTHLSKGNKAFLVGDNLTLADIIVAAPLAIPY